MSDFVIYLRLKPFVRQYLEYHFGTPVKFDDHSVTNARIISVLTIRKKDEQPETASDDLTPICIPYSKQKDPASWNYVSEHGKRFIIEHIESVFMDNLWNEMRQMCGDDKKLQSAAFAWCEMHGIDLEYADTIRMRYYREKMKFLNHGIDLRSKNRKSKDFKKN
jgi:hypothetical protein